MGTIRSVDSLALALLRLIGEEARKDRTVKVIAQLPVEVATYLMNEKRDWLNNIETKSGAQVVLVPNKYMETPAYEIRRVRDDEAQLPENNCHQSPDSGGSAAGAERSGEARSAPAPPTPLVVASSIADHSAAADDRDGNHDRAGEAGRADRHLRAHVALPVRRRRRRAEAGGACASATPVGPHTKVDATATKVVMAGTAIATGTARRQIATAIVIAVVTSTRTRQRRATDGVTEQRHERKPREHSDGARADKARRAAGQSQQRERPQRQQQPQHQASAAPAEAAPGLKQRRSLKGRRRKLRRPDRE